MAENPEPARPHILLVESDRDTCKLVSSFLDGHGFRITIARDGVAVDRILAYEQVNMLVMDIALPGESGLGICRRLAAQSRQPILLLAALADDASRIASFEAGADDFLAKPFNPRELLARIRAILRRCPHALTDRSNPTILSFAGWKLYLALRQLNAPDGVRVQLTSMGFDLLAAFCRHPRQVLSRERLLELTQGHSELGRSVDIQVSRLRRRIEPNPHNPSFIKTVRTGGYIFTPKVMSQ